MATTEAPIEIVTPNKRYPPVGRCIYCGVYTKKLTNEHIIAHGLAGDSLILPKASCRTCAEKTRDAETACLRHLWWPFRTRIGTPRKESPSSFIVRHMKVQKLNPDGSIAAYEQTGETVVGPMGFPLVFIAYKFPFPGIVIGRDPNFDAKVEIIGRISEEEFRKVAPNDREGFRIAPVNVEAYCRMLAKIAHAYAVAELGFDAFRPVLANFIRGQPLRQLWHWIGSDTVMPAAQAALQSTLHDIQWLVPTINGRTYVMVSLRLFSFIGSPRYHIIVGELTRPTNQLPFLQQPLYTIQTKTALPLGISD
jgi:hypothetical protein